MCVCKFDSVLYASTYACDDFVVGHATGSASPLFRVMISGLLCVDVSAGQYLFAYNYDHFQNDVERIVDDVIVIVGVFVERSHCGFIMHIC